MTASEDPSAPTALPPSPTRRIVRDVFLLAWPAMLQAFMQTVVFFFDRLMLGRHSKLEIAAMIPAGTTLWSITSIFGVWTVGTLAVVARDKGARKENELPDHIATSIALALGLGIIVGLAGILASPLFVAFFGVAPDVAPHSLDYLRILLTILPVTFVGLTLMAAFVGAGDTVTPMLAAAVSNVVNIAGNYVLIFGEFGFPELGMRGAAFASAAAFIVNALILGAALLRKGSALPFKLGHVWRFSNRSARRILSVSFPAAIERLIFHAGFIGYARIVTGLGTAAMAAQEALIAIQSIVFLPGEGFGVAAGSITGRNLGAGRLADAEKGVKVATWMAVTPLVLAGFVFLSAPGTLIGLFTEDSAIVAIGIPALIIGSFEGLFLGSFQAISGGMRGAGDTRTPMIVTTIGIWFVRLPLCAILGLPPELTLGLGQDLGLKGVWIGTLSDWIIRAVMITWAFRKGRWKQVKV